jgi:hypothetical protein
MGLVINIAGTVLVLGLAVLGVFAVIGLIVGDEGERQAKARSREAERHIQDLGHQAQVAIMRAAILRADRRDLPPEDRPVFDGWSERPR